MGMGWGKERQVTGKGEPGTDFLSMWEKLISNKNGLCSNLDFLYGLLVPAKPPALESAKRVHI